MKNKETLGKIILKANSKTSLITIAIAATAFIVAREVLMLESAYSFLIALCFLISSRLLKTPVPSPHK